MKLLSSEYDPTTGITEEYWHDDSTKKLTIRRLQDVEDQLDFNTQAYNSMGNVGYGDSKGGAHHVARIPFTVIEKWRSEGFDWFQSTDKERRRRLNDPDNRKFLVRPGRL